MERIEPAKNQKMTEKEVAALAELDLATKRRKNEREARAGTARKRLDFERGAAVEARVIGIVEMVTISGILVQRARTVMRQAEVAVDLEGALADLELPKSTNQQTIAS